MLAIFIVLLYVLPIKGSQGSKSNVTWNSENYGNPKFQFPNLFFVGISKCGTTSMAQLLTKHPMIVAVGNKDGGIAGESHIYDHISNVSTANSEQEKRLRKQLQKLTPERAQNITENGIIMHYTPHYMGVDSIEKMIYNSIRKAKNNAHRVKYLIMLRSPASRAVSSWWYKSGCYKHKCPPLKLQPAIDKGFNKLEELERCFTKHNINITSTILTVRRDRVESMDDLRRKLDQCPIKILKPEDTSMYSAHIGKSLYVYQLLHWLASIHRNQIYIMILDNFVADPVREMELFFNFLNLPIYGDNFVGFKSPKQLLDFANEKHNVHPVPTDLMEKEVTPKLESLKKAFEPSVYKLCMLLSSSEDETRGCTGEWSQIAQMMKKQHEESFSTMK